ncbi:Ceramide synthase 4 [Cucumispora dikerogammari]|nr:Ceramide synthase 4 [Cucumispora dikerogammari]
MCVHHILTLILLIGSLKTNHTIIGSHILALHEISDPFLELAKLFHKMKYKRASKIVFIIFALIFCLMRIILFPVYCVYPAVIKGFFYSPDVMFTTHYNKAQYHNDYTLKTLACCLIILLIMNCIWFGFILKLLKKILYDERLYDIIKDE